MTHPSSLNIKKAYDILLAALPSTDYRLIPDESFDERWWSLRMAMPFNYPDGEQMYVYIEVADGGKQLLRLHDDGVMQDWIEWHDLNGFLRRHKKKLAKDILPKMGLRFNRNNNPLQVTVTSHIDQAMTVAPTLCKGILECIEFLRNERPKAKADEPGWFDNSIERLLAAMNPGGLVLAT